MARRWVVALLTTLALASPAVAFGQGPRSVVGRVPRAQARETGRHVGWGTFFGGVGLLGAVVHAPLVASAGAGASVYHFTKAHLLSRDHPHAHQVAKNVGWGTFFTGVAVIGAIAGGPLTLAVGAGAAAYNFIKASFLHRQERRAGP
jgi:hypothetical protein